ncbi:MAG: terminase gpA endonuclease subunit [Bryobacteraceae bacterium]
MAGIDECVEHVLTALEPPPKQTVSEWADANRRLSPETSAEPGEWRTDRAPYQRGILDALSPNSPHERVVFMSSSQVGKCLALDTPIPTPNGWTTMGELQVGDRVFDDQGQPTTVMGTSAVFTGHACYRIRFEDGGEIVADAGHLWPVHDRNHGYKRRLVTTEEMAASVCAMRGSRGEFRYRVACAALELPEKLRRLSAPATRLSANRRRSIISIEPVPSVPVCCIAVDSPSHLFLAGRGMIPTHNTECVNSFIGYIIDRDPGPVLVVLPRVEDGEAWSKDRLAPMLRDTPCLRGKVADVRSRDSNNRILHKRFPGGSITIAGANSPAGLAMRPIRYVLLDEVDRYPASAGSEGDPVALAVKRSSTWWNRKIFLASSPTAKGASRIESWWLRSNQSSFWAPCPECGEYQVLTWEQLEWPEGQPDLARYRCEHCQALIAPHRKPWMLARGEWRAANPKSKIAGFWINQLYSPWKEWPETAVESLEAKAGGPETWRAFVNTSLGRPYDDEAETSVDIAALLNRRESFGARLSAGVAVLTVGVDLQVDRAELELVGWGRGEESWSCGYYTFPGDPSVPALWKQLDEFLNREWVHEYGIKLPVAACAIDSGFHTEMVYQFTRERFHRRIFAVKGKAGSIPVWPRRPTRNTIGRTPVWIIGVDSAKSVIRSRLKIEQPGPGYSHFPLERTAEWFEQLLSETLVTTYSRGTPVREWKRKKGLRAEVLDARCYSYAALCGLVAMGLRLDVEAERIEALRPEPQAGGLARRNTPSEAAPERKVFRSQWMQTGRRPF